MLAKIKVKEKERFNDCIKRLIGNETILVSFKGTDIFIDNLSERRICTDMLFLKLKNSSHIYLISESRSFSNGISIEVDTIHFKNALDMCKNEPFEIVIDDFYFEVNQGNVKYKALLMEVKEFETRKFYDKNVPLFLSKSDEPFSSLKIEMSEIVDVFKRIRESETFGKLSPRYNFIFSEKRVIIEKGDVGRNSMSVTMFKYEFSGFPTTIKFMEGIEKIEDIFSHDSIIEIGCHNGKMIQISQEPTPGTTITFLMGGMTDWVN